jgi:hypothetical protein
LPSKENIPTVESKKCTIGSFTSPLNIAATIQKIDMPASAANAYGIKILFLIKKKNGVQPARAAAATIKASNAFSKKFGKTEKRLCRKSVSKYTDNPSMIKNNNPRQHAYKNFTENFTIGL